MQEKKLTGYPSIDKPWLKYYSEEAINASVPECTIYEYLWENNKDHLDDVALNYFDRKITYGELFENIEKAAKAFSALGVKQGDIIVMATVTTPETIYAFYGLNRLGAISNMVDPRTSTEGIKGYISEVDAKLVLTIEAVLPKIEKAVISTKTDAILVVSPADSLPQPQKALFLLSNKLKSKTPKMSDKCLSWASFIKKGFDNNTTYSEYKKNHCCVIVHTGGTTGTPKGVMLSNDNLNVMAMQYKLLGVDYNRDQRFLNIMPPFIAYGVVCGIHMPLVLGLIDVLIVQLDPNKFADLVKKYKPAHMLGVPNHFENMRTSPKMKGFDLDFFESTGAGGDGIPEQFERGINSFLKEHGSKYQLAKGYGMTEISSAAVACHGTVNKLQSAGVPHLKTVVSVFEPNTDNEMTYGSTGEICMSAPTVMLGYYNHPEETNYILRKHRDGRSWIHSGDIGHMDEDGFLFVDGRIKRVIVRHDGFKVFPSQIENVISKCNSVNACCAVGVTDKSHSQGKLPIVFVVKSSNENDDAVKSELFELCKKELPEYAQPVDFVFTDVLPLTPIGKVDYRALEKQAEEMSKK